MSLARLPEESKKKKKPEGLVENIIVLIQAIGIALIIRTLLIQPFVIPSGSMKSTLLIGDYLMATKWSYGYSHHSLPTLRGFLSVFNADIREMKRGEPLFNGRILGSDPKQGDVAIFRPPNDMENDYIKRVVGVPGDKIAVKQGRLIINGVETKLVQIGIFIDGEGPYGVKIPQYKQTLPNGVTHDLLKNFERPSSLDNMAEITVPPAHFFMMGDNRDNSSDSRVFGPVPLENFVAKAQFLFFSVGEGEAAWTFWRWPWSVRPERLLNLIK
jgi:signal peptidase I